ncbi:MAG: hypothetical protein LBF68_07530 [Christensenellaceae bacterium]|nr:hypothetical protein [Christensenellaceae bacterium]
MVRGYICKRLPLKIRTGEHYALNYRTVDTISAKRGFSDLLATLRDAKPT